MNNNILMRSVGIGFWALMTLSCSGNTPQAGASSLVVSAAASSCTETTAPSCNCPDGWAYLGNYQCQAPSDGTNIGTAPASMASCNTTACFSAQSFPTNCSKQAWANQYGVSWTCSPTQTQQIEAALTFCMTLQNLSDQGSSRCWNIVEESQNCLAPAPPRCLDIFPDCVGDNCTSGRNCAGTNCIATDGDCWGVGCTACNGSCFGANCTAHKGRCIGAGCQTLDSLPEACLIYGNSKG